MMQIHRLVSRCFAHCQTEKKRIKKIKKTRELNSISTICEGPKTAQSAQNTQEALYFKK